MNHVTVATDEEGFLIDKDSWSEEIARQLASHENIELNSNHWKIIHAAQQFHQQFELSPAMRPFVKFLKQTIDPDINSIYLLKLFPQSPAKIASKIAGLPKPENCL